MLVEHLLIRSLVESLKRYDIEMALNHVAKLLTSLKDRSLAMGEKILLMDILDSLLYVFFKKKFITTN